MKTVTLRDGKERSLQRRHPWVFEGSVAGGKADPGETVRVNTHAGQFAAWASYSPSSMIRLRAWSFDEAERIDAAFFERRINRAVALRAMLDQGRRFDAIVLDPPKLAPTAAHAERAARAYKDINRLALKLLEPGGVLFTFSCSGGISADLFHKIVASAGADAGVDGFITERLAAAPDHPMTLEFPEGEYLKGLVVLRK